MPSRKVVIIKPFSEDNERGAIVLEATIALAVFIFSIFTILSIINICFIQVKIGSSLAFATKEVSQYSYLYYKFNLDERQSKLNDANTHSRSVAGDTIEGIKSLMNSFNKGEGADTVNISDLLYAVNEGKTQIESMATLYKNELSDPKAFIMGMAKLAGEELSETGKNFLGQLVVRSFIQKNLIESSNDDADSFLRRYKIKDGLSGLDFNGSSLMAYGKNDEIQMVVTYQIEVVRLLNIDINFTVRQCAKSSAWGNGVSLISKNQVDNTVEENDGSVWDLPQLKRGKIISDNEKANFRYTSGGNGFDGYDNEKNQFIQITSMYGTSYKTVSGVKSKLIITFNDMFGKVSKLSENIAVNDMETGSEVTLKSSELTRAYKIVLVVPDNADIATINKAVNEYLSEQRALGDNVSVEVKTGYGSPTESIKERSDK